jgi:hypothetical protein
MNKFITLLSIAMLTGCQTVYLKDKSVKKNGDSHVVTAIQASVLSDQRLQDLDVDYNGVKIKVQNWATKGDAVFVDALGSAISNGILAYGTFGGSEAVKAAVSATLKDKITDAAENPCADGNCTLAK